MDLSQVTAFNVRQDDKSGTFSVRFSSPPPTTPVSPEKNIRQTQSEGHSTKSRTISPQNCRGYQKQGKPEKLTVRQSPRTHDDKM